MGLFSSIKNAVKKLWGGVKKVFSAVVKPFAKILSNKWVQGALMAVTLFTGGAALISAYSGAGGGFAGMKAAGNLILKKAAEIITTPIDLVSKGVEAVGNVTGIDSLTNFAKTVQDGLGTVVDKAGSIFNVAGDDPNSIATQFADDTTKSFDGNVPEDMTDKVINKFDPQAEKLQGGGPTPPLADTPSQLPKPGGFLSQFRQKMDGLAGWIEKNPQTSKLALDTIAGMTSQNQYEQEQEAMAKHRQFLNDQFAPYANTGWDANYPGRFDALRNKNAQAAYDAAQSRRYLANGAQ